MPRRRLLALGLEGLAGNDLLRDCLHVLPGASHWQAFVPADPGIKCRPKKDPQPLTGEVG